MPRVVSEAGEGQGCAKPRGPVGRRQGLDPRAANGHASAPPSSAPWAKARAVGLASPRGADPSGSLEPLPHPGPGARSPHRSLESGRPGLCKQLFKGFLQFSAPRGCLFHAHLPTLKIHK